MRNETWTPAKLAEVGVYVCIDYAIEDIAIVVDGRVQFLITKNGRSDVDYITHAYAEATRIAKEREHPNVYHHVTRGWDISEFPYCITDNRIVGETPEDELEALREVTHYSGSSQDLVDRLYNRLSVAQRAIAAARKEGE